MRARAPASSANLGPGFDTLAVALDCYVSVDIEDAPSLRVHSEGEGSGLFDDASHLAARVAAEVLGHDHFAVTVRSQIPVARGLGSSAALAAAAAAAAGAEDPFAVAAAYDGHPENAAASVFGGLVVGTTVDGLPVHAPLPLSERAGLRRHHPRTQPGHPRGPRRAPRDADPGGHGVQPRPYGPPGGRPGRPGRRSCPRRRTTASTSRRARPSSPRRRSSCGALVDAGALAASWSGAGPTLIGIVRAGSAASVLRRGRGRPRDGGGAGPGAGAPGGPPGIVYGDEADVPL